MKLTLKIIFILFFISQIAQAQSVNIIIKLKASAPPGLVQSLKNNFKSSEYNLTRLLSKYNAEDSKILFPDKSLKKIPSKDIISLGFDRIYKVRVDSKNLFSLIMLINADKDVEYAEKLNQIRLNNFIPNDPYYSNQYYLNKINSPQSYEITQGDSTIVIGVIDSGLDFTHPDLRTSFKVNYEELSNGIDDDGNGYIDDIRGWNFVDDNNNPQDNNLYSHGTSVTGIINASINNGIGIASIAPNCKVLVLKAFDENGVGGEDNVARAILYGTTEGVRIFNMSFGDVIYSRLMRDVIRYAYSKNIILISSAGNTGNDELHYPSAFDEVISVGASDANDFKASFSSFGETVDIFAPGNQILTTSIKGKGSDEFGKDYFYVNGTSFSAPIVSASAALLLSRNNALTNEEIRGILVSTTDYMTDQTIWDKTHSSGRINLYNALLNYNKPSDVRFTFPYQDYTTFSDTIPISVTATSTFFESYSVTLTDLSGTLPLAIIVNHRPAQSINETIGNIELQSYKDTSLYLHLILYTTNNRTIEKGIFINKDTKPPVISDNFSNADIFEDNQTKHLVSFATNKSTIGKIFFRKENSSDEYQYIYADLGYENIGYVSPYHFALINENNLLPGTQYEFYIQAEGLNGKITTLINQNFIFFTQPFIEINGFNKKNYFLPPVQFLDTVVDIHNSGAKDLFVNLVDSNLRIAVYEFSGTGFNKISHNEWGDLIVGRTLGYVNQTGKLNLIASMGRKGMIYEQTSAGTLPSKLIWSDQNSNFWVSKIFDINRDGVNEVFGFGTSALRILQFNNSVSTELASLPYSSASSEPNSQSLLIGNFNNDGSDILAFTDISFNSSGHAITSLNIYKHISGNQFSILNSLQIPGELVKGECLAEADVDNDGIKEICLLTSTESGNLLSYYTLHIFKFINNQITELNPFYFYNTTASSSFISVENFQKDYLYINIGNNLYVLTYNTAASKLKPIYFRNDIKSFNQIFYDFDGNGIKETGIMTKGDSSIFIENISNPLSPLPPVSIRGYSDDSNKVIIKFSEVNGASYYKIYKSLNDSAYTLIDSTSNNYYTDFNVLNKNNYYYKISTVSNSFQNKESILSDKIKVYVHNRIHLLNAKADGYNYLKVSFSGSISRSIPLPENFILSGLDKPVSIIFKNDSEYILNFDKRLPNGNYTLRTINLNDFYNSPIDSNLISFGINLIDSLEFYIKNAAFINKNLIKVEFNLDVDSASVTNITNYLFEPPYIKIIKGVRDNNNLNTIYLTTSGEVGASGINYFLRIQNLLSQSLIPIVKGSGSSYSFSFVKESLSEVLVYPNPFVKSSSASYLTFANLTKQATVYIFDITGRFVNKLETKESTGGIKWDLRDSNGNDVPTGIYIYRATGKDSSGKDVEENINKFAVIK